MKIFIVFGGSVELDPNDYYNDSTDTTEIFYPSVGSWKAGAALPSPQEYLRAVNIDNKILIFGIYIYIYVIYRLIIN